MRRFALLAVAGLWLAVASCGDRPAPIAVPVQPNPDVLVLRGLLSCQGATADIGVATIGPEGGTIAAGPHSLRVPAGSLDSAVTITARVLADDVVAVNLEPEGLVFSQPAILTLSYAHCGVLQSLLPKRIVYTSDVFEILDLIPSIDNLLARRVTGRLDHFSTYAVAW